MWCPAHTLPTLSSPASTRSSNEEAAGSPSSSATPGWVSAAVWPSPKGAPVRWGRVESLRLCCWGRAKWVRWEGTLLGDGSSACPPSIKGVMQFTRDDITPTEARWARRVTKDTSCVGLLPGHQALVVRAGSQGQSHTPEVMQAGITLHSSSGNMTRLRLHDPEEILWFFVCAVTIRSSPRWRWDFLHSVTQGRFLLTNSSILNTLQSHHHTHHFVCGLMGNFLNEFATFK